MKQRGWFFRILPAVIFLLAGSLIVGCGQNGGDIQSAPIEAGDMAARAVAPKMAKKSAV